MTEGKLTVVGLSWVDGDYHHHHAVASKESDLSIPSADGTTSRAAVLAMMAATEARSEHPLAKAAATYGKDLVQASDINLPEITINSFESVTGSGVKSTMSLAGFSGVYTMYIGTARFVSQTDYEDVRLPQSLLSFTENETSQGRTVTYVSLSSSLAPSHRSSHASPVVAISLSDVPKASSKRAIESLRKMGVEVAMMTGDGHATALAIAREVGIKPELVWASMSPKGKAVKVAE